MDKTYSFITGLIVVTLASTVALAGETKTQETREIAATEFSGAYLEQVKDEKAAENLRNQADSEAHDKYLKSMTGGRDR